MYNGFWFSPEREALQAAIDSTQKFVTGTVRLKLYKVRLVGYQSLSNILKPLRILSSALSSSSSTRCGSCSISQFDPSVNLTCQSV